MHRLIPFALMLVLVACGRGDPGGDFRGSGPIYSNAVMDTSSLAGEWTQVATFADADAPCRQGRADIATTPSGLTIAARLCLNGAEVALNGPLAATGPGRVTPMGRVAEPLGTEWWVLWVDADLRTLVIGTPSGRFGFVLNRGGKLPADRLTAARDVLAWNGYDTARLRLLD